MGGEKYMCEREQWILQSGKKPAKNIETSKKDMCLRNTGLKSEATRQYFNRSISMTNKL